MERTKKIKVYNGSLSQWSATVTPDSARRLPSKFADLFALSSKPTTLYPLSSSPPNRQVDREKVPIDIRNADVFEMLEENGKYSIHEKVVHLSFNISPSSPLTNIEIPVPRSFEDAIGEAKKAMLRAYNLAPDSECIVQALRPFGSSVFKMDVETPEAWAETLEQKLPLRLVVERNSRFIPGAEVGVRNVVELAAKMMMVFGPIANTPTSTLDMLGSRDFKTPIWIATMLESFGIPQPQWHALWLRMNLAYEDISAQVMHITYSMMMPEWDEIDEAEAVECFSPRRVSILKPHVEATKAAKKIIQYLVAKGLQENVVMIVFYLKSILRRGCEAEDLLYGNVHTPDGQLRQVFLNPQTYRDMTHRELYVKMMGEDPVLSKWADMRLQSLYDQKAVEWPH